MDEVITFECGGYKYTARYCRMYDYYWLQNENGYTWKVNKEDLRDVFGYKESIERTSNE